MKRLLYTLLFSVFTCISFAHIKTIHIFVALCDNENQGIVPVPASLGNGEDPNSNLYWGAAYGVKSYLKYKTKDWELVETVKSYNPKVLERVLFKHKTKDVYLLADAYDGRYIKSCIQDFLRATNQQNPTVVIHHDEKLNFGGNSNLVSYVGHDGLMEFEVHINYFPISKKKIDVVILACASKDYFAAEIKEANASPFLWTTNLMAPEAYTLKAAIDGWMNQETNLEIRERAAQAYNRYQKCGITGARNLFTCGF